MQIIFFITAQLKSLAQAKLAVNVFDLQVLETFIRVSSLG